MTGASSSSEFKMDLIHPEVLTTAQLHHLLIEQKFHIDSSATREDLLDLFGRTLQPLPQRPCLPNRRGKLLLKNRQEWLSKRKIDSSTSNNSKKLKTVTSRISNPDFASPKKSSTTEQEEPCLMSSEKKSRFCDGSDESNSTKNRKFIKLINETLTCNSTAKQNGDGGKLHTKNKNTEDSGLPKKKHKPITWP